MLARENRHRYAGKVRVLIPFTPWRLLLTTRGLDLSASGVSAVLDPVPGTSDADDDRNVLLVEGDHYDVQLEDDAADLPTPMLSARLVRREATAAGLKLAFTFQQPNAELLAFVHDLSARHGTRQ